MNTHARNFGVRRSRRMTAEEVRTQFLNDDPWPDPLQPPNGWCRLALCVAGAWVIIGCFAFGAYVALVLK